LEKLLKNLNLLHLGIADADYNRNNALHLAAKEGHKEAVEILLHHAKENGEIKGFVRLPGPGSMTASELASASGYLEVVEIIEASLAGRVENFEIGEK